MSRTNRVVALTAACLSVTAPAFGEQPQGTAIYQDVPRTADAKLTEEQRQKLLDDQRDAFIFHVETERALALKAYCETGMAPLTLCHPNSNPTPPPALPSASAAPPALPPADKPKPPGVIESIEAREMPLVVGLTGFADALTATVQYSNGNRLTIVAPHGDQLGSRLPNGHNVITITPKTDRSPAAVLVGKPGDLGANATPLLFAPVSTEGR